VGREEIRRFIYFKIERKYMSGRISREELKEITQGSSLEKGNINLDSRLSRNDSQLGNLSVASFLSPEQKKTHNTLQEFLKNGSITSIDYVLKKDGDSYIIESISGRPSEDGNKMIKGGMAYAMGDTSQRQQQLGGIVSLEKDEQIKFQQANNKGIIQKNPGKLFSTIYSEGQNGTLEKREGVREGVYRFTGF
jgi:hypothetical protein